MADEVDEAPIEPLGAPTDPMRPTGRVADQALASSKAELEAKARRALKAFLAVLAVAVLAAVLFFVVVALLPKPDL